MRTRQPRHLAQTSATDADFATLGRLAVALSPERLHDSLDRALDELSRALQADTVELYLADPEGHELILSACLGVDAEAVAARSRIPIGQGIPGQVAQDGQPISSPDLADERDARRTVILPELRSHAAVPLGDGLRVLGVLQATWKSQDAPVESARRLLEMAALPIGTAVQAGLSGLRNRVAEAFREYSGDEDVHAGLRALLHAMQEVAGFQMGTIFLSAGEREWNLRHVALPPGLQETLSLTESGELGNCPFLREGRPIVLTGNSRHWPALCKVPGDPTTCRACLPMRIPGGMFGALRVSYATEAPNPPTRYLASLEAMADEAARHLKLRLHTPAPPPPVEAAAPPVELCMEHVLREPAERPRFLIVDFRCFGRFEVLRNDEPIPPQEFKRNSALHLLKILLLQAGSPISRDALCELLWPGVGASAGANRLHGAVHALRQALEPRAAERQWLFICGRGEHYYFNLGSPSRVDLLEFKKLAAQGKALLREGTSEAEAMRCLEAATLLYRGDLFEDDPYAEWCWSEREALRDRYLEALTSLGRLWAKRRDYDRSVEAFRRALRASPTREDVHQALMETLWQCGRRKEALEQYDECVGVLRRELDAEPLPATRDLHRHIVESLREPEPPVAE